MRRRFTINTINKGFTETFDDNKYLTIEALEDNLSLVFTNDIEYGIDGKGWIKLRSGYKTPYINTGQTLSFKGNLTPSSSNGIGTFAISKKCNIKGNIMSLLYGDDFEGQTDLTGKRYAFYQLFYNCTNIVDASELILPTTTLASSCYGRMFYGCTSLTTAPELPATTLASNCYDSMFSSCRNLTTAPELPATTLAYNCYYCMFSGTNVLPDCSNIDFSSKSVVSSGGLKGLFYGTKVTDTDLEQILPKNNEGKYCLPATTLAYNCYQYMFSDCRNLTTAPELPATTLASNCYYGMFVNCSNLNYIKMLATDISERDCLYLWVSGVSSTGTFVKNANMTSLPSGANGIPSGWTVVDN